MRLTGVDAAWFHLDRHENTADIVVLLLCREPLDFSRLRQAVEERLLRHDRFTQRVVESKGPFGRPRWERDPEFSLDRHLERRQLTSGTPGELERFVSEVTSAELEGERPPWKLYVVDGVRGGGSALVGKLHHCIADGFALARLMLALADEAPRAPSPPRAPRPGPPSRRGVGRRALRQAGELRKAGAALVRILQLPPDPPTVLTRRLSGRRRTVWSEGFPLSRVKEAARARSATVNDLLLAALAGALRRYLEEANGERVDELAIRAFVPVNLRPVRRFEEMREELGNRFGLVYLDLPVGEASADRRLESLRDSMSTLKRSADAIVSLGLLGLLGRLPRPIEHAIADFLGRKASIVVTNVRGPARPLSFAGSAVEHIMFWAPHAVRLGVGVSIMSYAGEVRIGVRADIAVMPDAEHLVRFFELELALLEQRLLEDRPAPVPT